MPKQAAKRPKPGKRAAKKEATRQRIVNSALELFQTRGFHRTTTKDIARRARIAEGTVFNYFPTKDDIALTFFEQEVDHAIDAVRNDKRLRKRPLEEKLFALIQNQLEYLAPYESFIGASIVEALKPGSRLGPFNPKQRELQYRYVAFVDELLAESLPNRRLTAYSWVGPHIFGIVYLGVLLYWLHDDSPAKQNTLALLDRALKIVTALLAQGAL